MSDTERVYVPYQHVAQPQGCKHLTCFANVELWIDDPPDVMEFAGLRYRVDDSDRKECQNQKKLLTYPKI